MSDFEIGDAFDEISKKAAKVGFREGVLHAVKKIVESKCDVSQELKDALNELLEEA